MTSNRPPSKRTIGEMPEVEAGIELRYRSPEDITALYIQGRCIRAPQSKNPDWEMSHLGIVWAWVAVGQGGSFLLSKAGILLTVQEYRRYLDGWPYAEEPIHFAWRPEQRLLASTARLIAGVLALEAMPDPWRGTVYCDNAQTLQQLLGHSPMRGTSADWQHRVIDLRVRRHPIPAWPKPGFVRGGTKGRASRLNPVPSGPQVRNWLRYVDAQCEGATRLYMDHRGGYTQ